MTNEGVAYELPDRPDATATAAIDDLFVAEQRYQSSMAIALHTLRLDDVNPAIEGFDEALFTLRRLAPVDVGDAAEQWVAAAKLTPREPTISDDDYWLLAVAKARRRRQTLDDALRAWCLERAAADVSSNARGEP